MDNQKCIQSFSPHGIQFKNPVDSPNGDETPYLVIPAGHEKKNIVLVDDETLEKVQKDPTFKAMLDAKVIRILDNVPKRYQDATETLAEVRGQLLDLQTEKTVSDEKAEALRQENEKLKKDLEAAKKGE